MRRALNNEMLFKAVVKKNISTNGFFFRHKSLILRLLHFSQTANLAQALFLRNFYQQTRKKKLFVFSPSLFSALPFAIIIFNYTYEHY